MSSTEALAGTRSGATPRPRSAGRLVVLSQMAILAVAALLAALRWTTVDVSWLILVGHRLLDGERLYVDILETNPPLSVGLYMPFVLVERIGGIPAEASVIIATLVSALASVAFCTRILERSEGPAGGSAGGTGPVFAMAALTALTILPLNTFAQREHVALIALLPVLALFAGRLQGAECSRSTRLVAGALAGLAACIKPQFAAAVVLPALLVAIRRRNALELARPELLLSAAVVVAYAAIVLALFPDFLSVMLPIVTDVYRPARISWNGALASAPLLLLYALALAAFFAGPRRLPRPLPAVLLAAALGFFLSFLEQRKGWPYHLYPAFALGATALAVQIAATFRAHGRIGPRAGTAAVAGLIALLLSTLWLRQDWAGRTAVVDILKAEAPGASVYAITDDLALVNPLTRAIGGRFQASTCALWIAHNAAFLKAGTDDPSLRTRMDGWIASDTQRAVADLERIRPTVILVDGRPGRSWPAFAASDPRIAAILARYRRLAAVDGVEILLRVDDRQTSVEPVGPS